MFIKPFVQNMIDLIGKEHDITTGIQKYFTNTIGTTKNLNDSDKILVYQILKDVGFYNMEHIIGLKSARIQDATKYLPKAKERTLNLPSPPIEIIEDSSEDESDKLQGEEVKIIIPSNRIDIYTRLEILLGLKLSGHTDTLTEASNLIDELL